MSDKKEKVSTDRFFNESVAAFSKAIDVSTRPFYASHAISRQAYHATDEKSVEIQRQITRITPFLVWAKENSETGLDEAGLNWSISFLRAFANSPAPVPMLAVGNDGKASAYLNDGIISLEAVYDSENIQYLLSNLETGICDYFEEKSANGSIPPNVMVAIYQHFARNNQKSSENSTENV